MPLYSYRCDKCYTIWDVLHEFAENHTEPCESCEGELRKYYGFVQVSAGAYPTRGTHDSKLIDWETSRKNEKNKEADLAAYKRLRKEGLQPPSTVGAAELESKAETKWEVTAGKTLRPETRKQGEKQLQEFLG